MTLFDEIGGEGRVRTLVDRFYDLMDTLPEARLIRALHPPSLDGSRDKLYWFLVGWTGGPPMYIERFGHPRLRARHLPFSIGDEERDQWMLCMRRAVAELGLPESVRLQLEDNFQRLADHMRNRPQKQP
jgi:hemoglobin